MYLTVRFHYSTTPWKILLLHTGMTQRQNKWKNIKQNKSDRCGNIDICVEFILLKKRDEKISNDDFRLTMNINHPLSYMWKTKEVRYIWKHRFMCRNQFYWKEEIKERRGESKRVVEKKFKPIVIDACFLV